MAALRGLSLGSRQTLPSGVVSEAEKPMLDILFLVVAVAFFAIAVAYVQACDRM
jgi:hypothetical protein